MYTSLTPAHALYPLAENQSNSMGAPARPCADQSLAGAYALRRPTVLNLRQRTIASFVEQLTRAYRRTYGDMEPSYSTIIA